MDSSTRERLGRHRSSNPVGARSEAKADVWPGVAITATHPDGEVVTTLLDANEYAEESYYPKGGLNVARQRTLDDLGPLVPSQRQVALKTLIGPIAGEKVYIHLGCHRNHPLGPAYGWLG